MYLGIDLGTTDVKVLLLSPGHQVVAVERSPLEVSRRTPAGASSRPKTGRLPPIGGAIA